MAESLNFGFGIEAEFLLVDKNTYRPLFHQDLNFENLIDLLDAIPVSDFSAAGFNIKPLHRLASPYLVEGYYLTDRDMKPYTLLPKGVELRTPLTDSIDQCVSDLRALTERLDRGLATSGWKTAMISHHPTECKFDAPANYTRHDYWQWALTAMTTFGPDINISLPEHLAALVNLEDLQEKINYYMPSLVAMTLASPLLNGELWQVRGQTGKSIRTYRRSLWAPLHYIHREPSLRFEFKGFEMAHDLDDYKAMFLLCLTLLLDQSLTGRASDQTRIYDLGQIAVEGVAPQFVKDRATSVLHSAGQMARSYGFDSTPLQSFYARLESGKIPADDIIDVFKKTGSVANTMRSLAGFKTSESGAAAKALFAPTLLSGSGAAELCVAR